MYAHLPRLKSYGAFIAANGGRAGVVHVGEPGIGLEVVRWVAEKDLCLTAADTWAVEVVPNPDKNLAFMVHTELQTKLGILNRENLVFDDLIADRNFQLVYTFTRRGSKTRPGSRGCPIAVTEGLNRAGRFPSMRGAARRRAPAQQSNPALSVPGLRRLKGALCE
jgi:hypothetical protein